MLGVRRFKTIQSLAMNNVSCKNIFHFVLYNTYTNIIHYIHIMTEEHNLSLQFLEKGGCLIRTHRFLTRNQPQPHHTVVDLKTLGVSYVT